MTVKTIAMKLRLLCWLILCQLCMMTTTSSSVSSSQPQPPQQYQMFTLEDLLHSVQHDLQHVETQRKTTSLSTRLLPKVTLSYAQTLDASIAPSDRTRMSISSPSSFALLHSLRKIHDAVLIGGNTLLYDNPRLTVRCPLTSSSSSSAMVMGMGMGTDAAPSASSGSGCGGCSSVSGKDVESINSVKQPRPVILDTDLRNIVQCNPKDTVIRRPIVVTALSPDDARYQQALPIVKGLEGCLMTCPRDEKTGRCDLKTCLQLLRETFAIETILLEGGGHLIHAFLTESLVHQCVITLQCAFLGGYRSLPSSLPHLVALRPQSVKVARSLEGDVLIYGQIEAPSQALE